MKIFKITKRRLKNRERRRCKTKSYQNKTQKLTRKGTMFTNSCQPRKVVTLQRKYQKEKANQSIITEHGKSELIN